MERPFLGRSFFYKIVNTIYFTQKLLLLIKFYTSMKKIFPLLLILLCSTIVLAQNENVENLDVNLENYTYPFEVSFIPIENQQQKLQMGYMDIKPENYNGKNV